MLVSHAVCGSSPGTAHAAADANDHHSRLVAGCYYLLQAAAVLLDEAAGNIEKCGGHGLS